MPLESEGKHKWPRMPRLAPVLASGWLQDQSSGLTHVIVRAGAGRVRPFSSACRSGNPITRTWKREIVKVSCLHRTSAATAARTPAQL